uniref:Putative S-phase kinase-associated protein 1 n=1 Tax=Latrodectus hesperus TaxID=256737 RepID=E7D1W1_LATHE|nr:putative S-phase kinase-associated protein 1 [Latrodectus hesperus]
MSNLKLKSGDEVILEISSKVANKFNLFLALQRQLGFDMDVDDVFPVRKYRSSILRKAIEWMEHHVDDPPEVAHDLPVSLLSMNEWDNRFVDVDRDVLFDLLNVASFFNLNGLRNLVIDALANSIKGKTVVEICEILNNRGPVI